MKKLLSMLLTAVLLTGCSDDKINPVETLENYAKQYDIDYSSVSKVENGAQMHYSEDKCMLSIYYNDDNKISSILVKTMPGYHDEDEFISCSGLSLKIFEDVNANDTIYEKSDLSNPMTQCFMVGNCRIGNYEIKADSKIGYVATLIEE